MGRIRHSAIVVTGSEKFDAEIAHEKAEGLGLIVTPVISGCNNGYHSFMICPDGSKEGGDTSERFDRMRYIWCQWAIKMTFPSNHRAICHIDWFYVDFGGDDEDVQLRDWATNDDRKPQTQFT